MNTCDFMPPGRECDVKVPKTPETPPSLPSCGEGVGLADVLTSMAEVASTEEHERVAMMNEVKVHEQRMEVKDVNLCELYVSLSQLVIGYKFVVQGRFIRVALLCLRFSAGRDRVQVKALRREEITTTP